MSKLSQQQIDALIQFINETEDAESITNTNVAAVLAYLSDNLQNKADVSSLGGAKKLAMSQAPFVSLYSVEKTADELVPNNKMWWSTDGGRLKYKGQNGDVYILADSPPYILYYCGQEIYKWNGTGFIKMTDAPDTYFLDGRLKDSALPAAFLFSLGAALDACAKIDNPGSPVELITLRHSRIVLLDSMGERLDGFQYSPTEGDIVLRNGKYVFRYNGSGYDDDGVPLKRGAVYINKHTGKFYMWDGDHLKEIEIGAVVDVIDNLSTNDGTKALSAKQGKILKANIAVLNANINALRDALANIAFTSTPKPAMSELDWSGDKCAVAVNNSLTGCTANKSGTQQVSEGSDLVITITADNGNLLRSVTASAGTVVIAANRESATVTLAQIQADMSINITATATAKGSFAASINDSRVDGTGAASGITEGSAWSSVLSLNGTAGDGAAITAISASMEGGGTITVNGSTVSTEYVTGNITIVVTVVVPARVTITFPAKSTGVVITDNDNNDAVINDGVTFKSISEGGSINWKLAASQLFAIDTVTVQGGSATDNGDGTYTVAINNITDDVTITATTTTTNVAYKGVRFFPTSGKTFKIMAVSTIDNIPYVISPMIDLGERENSIDVTFSVGEANTACGLIYFDANFNPVSYNQATVADRQVSVGATYRFARLLMTTTNMASSYVEIGGNRVFDGAELVLANLADGEDYLASGFCEQPNENGDMVGGYFVLPERISDGNIPFAAIESAKYSNLNNKDPRTSQGVFVTEVGVEKLGYVPWVVGKKVRLHEDGDTTAISFTFSGGVKQAYAPYLRLYAANSVSFYDLSSSSPRTQSIAATWLHGRMICPLDKYQSEDCFIRNNSTQETLWENPKNEE